MTPIGAILPVETVIRFIRQSKEHDLHRISVADTPVYCLQTLDVKLLHPFMLI